MAGKILSWENVWMGNRQLSTEESQKLFNPLIDEIRRPLTTLSSGDQDLLWALRRKLFKELTYHERGKPVQRRKLKTQKRAEQDNKCAECSNALPSKYVVLDRREAIKGYTAENTRLLCVSCDRRVQAERGRLSPSFSEHARQLRCSVSHLLVVAFLD